ncbi:MAG: 2-C-methyl-D-erythritol 4-phosphate cytidylyltransferase [Actinomycetota bacterium]|nr:2-C-methyl-D-erythritol 4-phosphate cytidylyltransferase [Actinomycetota bacterium]
MSGAESVKFGSGSGSGNGSDGFVGEVTVGVVVVAAGAGTRLGADVPKAFARLGERSILETALDSVFGMSEAAQVVVVVPAEHLVHARELVRSSAGAAVEFASVVVGGETRQASVAAGLDALWPGVGVVLVHDAARSFTPTALFEAVVARVRATGDGVIPGLPVTDTLKITTAGRATETVDRSLLSAVQTPQGFPRAELAAAYAAASLEYTDDAALFAAAGHAVHVIEGDQLAFKITTPWDMRRAQQLADVDGARPSTSSGAVGIGVDVHAFDPTAELWLGGIHWPGEPGLAGHSDGDAVSHAICDALLSAAGLGDIGGLVGTDDPQFADAHGDVFIRVTIAAIEAAGFRIQNVAVQVIGNRPKLSPRRAEIEAHLGAVVGAPVSVSATTSDGLGFTGRGEGIGAIATALLSA